MERIYLEVGQGIYLVYYPDTGTIDMFAGHSAITIYLASFQNWAEYEEFVNALGMFRKKCASVSQNIKPEQNIPSAFKKAFGEK